MKLSFSIPSKSSAAAAARPTPAKAFDDDGGKDAAAAKPDYVTEFDASKPVAPDAPSKHVISPIPNDLILRPTKKMKNLTLPDPSDDPTVSETRFVLDSSASDPAAAAIPYGLTIRSSSAAAAAAPRSEENGRSSEDLMLRRYKEDMERLPDDRGFEEFAEIPVEDFAAALLSGYGWSEGKGIGRNAKEDTKVVEYNRRAGTEGIGYTPDPHAPRRKGSRLPPRDEEKAAPMPEKIVRIVSGKHAGLKGRMLEKSKDGVVVLKLLNSGEEVRIGADMIAELGSPEEDKCLSKLKELEVRSRDERRESSREERKSEDSRRDEKRSKDKRMHGNGSHHKSSGGGRERERERQRQRETVRWLTSHIKVRIVSKNFKGGRLYLKKGEILDVVGPTTCDISMDENGELVQSVDQEMLETALPKRGGSVLVLYGKHKGVYGSLVERDSEEETGVVRDADTHSLINVRLEQIAEYIGDPSYIGY